MSLWLDSRRESARRRARAARVPGRRPIGALLAGLLLIAAIGLGSGTPGLGADPPPAPSAVRLLRSEPEAIVVALELSDYSLRDASLGGETFQVIEAAGLDSLGQPGLPNLPGASVLLGVPPRGRPRLELSVGGTASLPGRLRIAPAPAPDAAAVEALLDREPAPGSSRSRTVVQPDAAAYASRGLFPSQAASIVETGWIRHQRVVRLALHPFQLRAATGQLQVHRRIEVTLRFDPEPAPAGDPGEAPLTDSAARRAPPDPSFDRVLAAALLNAGEARAWREALAEAQGAAPRGDDIPSEPDPSMPAERGPIWNILVRGEGMVRVTGADLALAGLPIELIDPKLLQLYDQVKPVAIEVEGEADGRLGAADALVFYGRPSDSRYAAERVYQLAIGTARGRRMARRAADPAGGAPVSAVTDTLRLEEDLLYRSDIPRAGWGLEPLPGVDRWYWEQLSAPQALVRTIAPPDPAPGDWSGRLGLRVVGKSDLPGSGPDHRLAVWLGGTRLGEMAWNGNAAVQDFDFDFPGSLLTAGPVELKIESVADPAIAYDQVYVDAVNIDYRRLPRARSGLARLGTDSGDARDLRVGGFEEAALAVYDIGDPAQVVRLEGVEVEAAEGAQALRFAPGGPGPRRFLALAPGAYLAPVQVRARPLATLRDPQQGADYLVIAPQAFHGSLAPLLSHRRGQGRRVALVDTQAIYDVFNGGAMAPEAIRDFIAHAYHFWAAPAPSHVLLVGDGTYDPRNRLGRSPPTLLPPFLKVADPWLGEVAVENAFATVRGDDLLPDLFVGRLPANTPAEAAVMANKIVRYETAPAGGDWRQRLLFAADDPDSAGDFRAISDDIVDAHVPDGYSVEKVYLGQTHGDRDLAREAIVTGMNRGYLLAQYVGHGLQVGWAQELILRGSDVRALTNGGRLPVLLDMTCMTGYFTDPTLFSISETAVRAEQGGAIGAFSPTGFGVATGHDIMNRAFVDMLLFEDVTALGELAVASKLRLGALSQGHRDLLETYALFGDPALDIPVPIAGVKADTPTPAPSLPPPSPSATPSATASATPEATPKSTATPDASATPGPGEPTPTETPAATGSPQGTDTPTAPAPGASATPEATPTGGIVHPSATPTGEGKPTVSVVTPATPSPPPPLASATPSSPPASPVPSVTARPPQPAYLPLLLQYRKRVRR